MAYRATRVSDNPLDYFLEHRDDGPLMHVSDVVLRENKDPKEVFAHVIRIATGSKWSHSAVCYLLSDPKKGYSNTYLIEAKTKGVRIASWRDEVVPFDQFTVGIKRLKLDWYKETPYEQSRRDPHDPKDVHGIEYLRQVRGIAFDQINSLYDHKTVFEVGALYARRAAKRHLSQVPQVAGTAEAIANLMKKWDEAETSVLNDLRFICSGLVQYSFFEALRLRIVNDLEVPEHKEVALQNLNTMHRVIFRDDPDHLISDYIHQVQIGKLDIHDPAPEDVLDLLKTATPADFNNSPNLTWEYVILKGIVWCIEEVAEGYQTQNEDEKELLEMLTPEHRSSEDEGE